MKTEISKAWCENMARKEGVCEVGVGLPGDEGISFFVCGGDDGSERSKSKQGSCSCGGETEQRYGFCKHGLGVFNQCVDCSAVYDFCEDSGQ